MNISSLTDEEYVNLHGTLSKERTEELIERVANMTKLIDMGDNVAGEVHCLQSHLDDVGAKLDDLQALLNNMVERFAELKLADNDDYGLMADIEQAGSEAKSLWEDIAKSATREDLGTATKTSAQPRRSLSYTPDVENCCLIAGFMWSGVKEDDKLLERWGLGCLELCQEVTKYAPLVEEMLQACFTAVPELVWMGVFDYEVSEPFGAWFREYIENSEPGTVPGTYMCVSRLGTDIVAFFNRNGEDLTPEQIDALHSAVDAVARKFLETHK